MSRKNINNGYNRNPNLNQNNNELPLHIQSFFSTFATPSQQQQQRQLTNTQQNCNFSPLPNTNYDLNPNQNHNLNPLGPPPHSLTMQHHSSVGVGVGLELNGSELQNPNHNAIPAPFNIPVSLVGRSSNFPVEVANNNNFAAGGWGNSASMIGGGGGILNNNHANDPQQMMNNRMHLSNPNASNANSQTALLSTPNGSPLLSHHRQQQRNPFPNFPPSQQSNNNPNVNQTQTQPPPGVGMNQSRFFPINNNNTIATTVTANSEENDNNNNSNFMMRNATNSNNSNKKESSVIDKDTDMGGILDRIQNVSLVNNDYNADANSNLIPNATTSNTTTTAANTANTATPQKILQRQRNNNNRYGNKGSKQPNEGGENGHRESNKDSSRIAAGENNFVLKPTPTISHHRLNEINAQALHVLSQIGPSEQEEKKKNKLLSQVQVIAKNLWLDAEVLLYGSSGNQFGLRNADVDMCMFHQCKDEENQAEVVLKLGDYLKKLKMKDVKPLPGARVPIIKFKDKLSGIDCDVCFNNLLGVANTKLLAMYGSIDHRVVEMARFVKFWAKRREINEPFTGTLSSYSYVLLVVYYCQTRDVPIVPNIQEIPQQVGVDDGVFNETKLQDDLINEMVERVDPLTHMYNDHNVYYCSDLNYVHSLGYGPNTKNTETLAELLAGFFHFFAYNFDYHRHVISPRTASILTREDKDWTCISRGRGDKYWLCIEDPFDLSHNLGRVVDKLSLYETRGEFMRAFRVLNSGGSIEELCMARPLGAKTRHRVIRQGKVNVGKRGGNNGDRGDKRNYRKKPSERQGNIATKSRD